MQCKAASGTSNLLRTLTCRHRRLMIWALYCPCCPLPGPFGCGHGTIVDVPYTRVHARHAPRLAIDFSSMSRCCLGLYSPSHASEACGTTTKSRTKVPRTVSVAACVRNSYTCADGCLPGPTHRVQLKWGEHLPEVMWATHSPRGSR